MSVQLRSLVISLVLGFSFVAPQKAQADAGREFLLSCTYGVLAGALVGAASLAVEDNPGDKLHRVARGASLGLYTGILLGLYVVYVVPAQLEAEEQKELDEEYEQSIDADDYGYENAIKVQRQFSYKPPKLLIHPVIENNRVTGAALNYSIIRF